MRAIVSVLLLLAAPAALAVDADSLRLRKAPGGVELSWTDATPTVACVQRDVVAPPATLLGEVAGLSFVDAPPSAPLLFYDVNEPASGTCGTVIPGCAPAAILACGVPLATRNDATGSADLVDAWGGCPGADASGPEIVFSFTAVQAGTHVARLLAGPAELDVRVLRDGGAGCDPAQCIAFDDVAASFDATPGATYFVVVDGQAGAAGDFTVQVDCPAPVACAPVASLACGGTDSRNTGDAGSSSVLVDHPACFVNGLSGREMIYSFTATADDALEARLIAGAAALDVLVLRDIGGGCETAECVAQGDAAASFAAVAGQQYFIVVDGAGATADYTIALTCRGAQCQPDQSLLCGQAIAHANDWPVFTDVNDSYPCSTLDYSGPEYVFRFTATGTGDATVTLSGLTAELDVFVTEEAAGCSPATCIATGDSAATFPVVAGTTYNLIVDGRDGAQGFFRIDLTCAIPASACDPHGVIRCGDLVGNDTRAGRDSIDAWPACSAVDASGPESVFLYSPTEDATVRLVMDLNVEDLDIMVVDNAGGGCSPANCIAWGDQEVTFDAVGGRTYSVIVDGRNGVNDTFRLWMDCRTVPGACRPARPIACGETVSGRNDAPGSTDAIDQYDCLPYPEPGPEFTYSFVAAADGTARATLSNLTGDLDLFVLRDDGLGCNQESCIGGANLSLEFPVVAGETYYLVVEGFTGAVGAYDLTLECL